MRKEYATIVPQSFECIVPLCRDTAERMIGRRVQQEVAPSLVVEQYPLLRRGHCEEEFLASEQSTLGFDTDGQGAMPLPNHIVKGGKVGLVV